MKEESGLSLVMRGMKNLYKLMLTGLKSYKREGYDLDEIISEIEQSIERIEEFKEDFKDSPWFKE